MAAGEAGRAGDQRLHRSATIVTGDPNRRSRPTAREHAFDGPRRAERSQALVQVDGQDELPADEHHAIAVRGECGTHVTLGQDAVGLDRVAEALPKAADAALEGGETAERREVHDHAPSGDAAEFRDALPPVDGVHQHAQADGRVDAAVGQRQVVRIGAPQRHGRACRARAVAGDAQHLERTHPGR